MAGRLEPEVRAAGGAVLRAGADRRLEVLLVHRPSHRDWTLPKGKTEPRNATLTTLMKLINAPDYDTQVATGQCPKEATG